MSNLQQNNQNKKQEKKRKTEINTRNETSQISHEYLLWHHPDSNYVDPIKLPYISGHQPLWYDYVTQVDNMDNQVTPYQL